MKIPGVALGALVVAAGVSLYFHESGSTPTAPTIMQSASPAGDARVAQLTRQVEALQRSLSAVQSQLASQKQTSAPDRAAAAKDSPPPELDVAAQRAQELERRRLARELHDETGQALTSILLGLRAVEDAGNSDDLRQAASDLRELVVATLQDVRRRPRCFPHC